MHSLRNRIEKITKGSPFYLFPLLPRLQMNLIFSDNVRILYIYIQNILIVHILQNKQPETYTKSEFICCHSFLCERIFLLSWISVVHVLCRLLKSVFSLEMFLPSGRALCHINSLNLPHFYVLVCPMSEPGFLTSYLYCYMFKNLKWEVIVCFVDIGVIVYNQCFNLPFMIINVFRQHKFHYNKSSWSHIVSNPNTYEIIWFRRQTVSWYWTTQLD